VVSVLSAYSMEVDALLQISSNTRPLGYCNELKKLKYSVTLDGLIATIVSPPNFILSPNFIDGNCVLINFLLSNQR